MEADAIEKLGLDSDKQYILVSGGSIGAGKVEWLVAVFERDYFVYSMNKREKLSELCEINKK